MNTFSLATILFLAGLSLGACSTSETYPVSGDQCGPNDPVKELDANDCLVPI